jgi:twitching motility protein PilT
MWSVEDLLAKVSSSGGSDLILTTGAPPKIKINGVLQSVGEQALTAEDAERLCLSVLNETQKEFLREKRSVDLSRGFPNVSRFRFNVFYQRGTLAMAARLIPTRIPSFAELACRPSSSSSRCFRTGWCC